MTIIKNLKTQRTPMTAEEFYNWLKRFADNGDGQLSKEELREALRFLGLHMKWWKVWRAMWHADRNRNRRIDGDDEFQELVKYAGKRWGIIIVDGTTPK